MKKLVIITGLLLITMPALAKSNHIIINNNTTVIEQSNNSFDYGGELQGILYQTPNTEWGIKGNYLYESNETTVMATGKIYLNHLLGYQK